MSNTTQRIWEILNDEEIIKKAMYQKLINHRALARYLQKKYSLNVSIDSIISAIRRFEITDTLQTQFEKIPNLLKGSDVSTKNNLVVVTLKKDVNLYKYLSNFIRNIEHIERQKLRFVIGDTSFKIIVGFNDLPLIESSFDKQKIMQIIQNLGEIKIHLGEQIQKEKGVAAKIISEISQQDINLVEIITSLPDFFIYVDEKDLPKAHETIINLCS